MKIIRPGLYEGILTDDLMELITLSGLKSSKRKLDQADAPYLLAQFLSHLTRHTLEGIDVNKYPEQMLEVTNTIISALRKYNTTITTSRVETTQEFLRGVLRVGENVLQKAPQTPLSQSALFTGSSNKPQLSNELLAEMRSADRVDILVSFIKESGLRLLRAGFNDLLSRNIKVRVITTTYMGASDHRAIESLGNYSNVEIKVSYDIKHTRLHAKAYFFHRESGYSTAYIGSSNMSNPAMSEGLEWNLKATNQDLPDILRGFESEFEVYWNSQAFSLFKPGVDTEKLKQALLISHMGGTREQSLVLFDITPRPYQLRILESLEAERKVRKSYKNLLVAATGTGKTVISAFDYKRFCEELGGIRPNILFIAHREEILSQSLQTFRQILKDKNFGEQMGGSVVDAKRMNHLFCTIQTANSKKIWKTLGSDFYDFIVIDEAHHSSASTYVELITGFSPTILLGMTATPERMDGDSILPFFNDKIAAELRLPEALEEKLLCPFQYFCVSDPISLEDDIFWDKGKYKVSALEKVYSIDQETAQLRLKSIYSALDTYLFGNYEKIKAIGFCVSIMHAEFMAQEFNTKGIPSVALTSASSEALRRSSLQALSTGTLKFIFTVDLFNEGVDIPELNLLLFLRPTDSLTVYLQQLGRGLRHSVGKECLVVLDFVSQMHKKYRADKKYSALLSYTRFNMLMEVQAGFPHVPPGCSIQLEKQAMAMVIQNIKNALSNLKVYVKETISTFTQDTGKALTFSNYIQHHDLDPIHLLDIQSWSLWKKEALRTQNPEEPHQKELEHAALRVVQASGPNHLTQIKGLPESGLSLISTNRWMANMLHGLIWKDPGKKLGLPIINASFEQLSKNPSSLNDLKEIADYRLTQTMCRGFVPYPDFPLELHAHYSNFEIQAAFGRDLFEGSGQSGVGVLHFPWCKAYALLITLTKSEKDFSPSTMYRDYPISKNLFHWESQSNTKQDSETGKNLIQHLERGYSIHLFVRQNSTTEKRNVTVPFQYMGKGNFESFKNECPIEIVWKMEHALPGELLEGTP